MATLLDSYKVFDQDDDGRISRSEFYEYFKDSWICAFRLLGEQVQRGNNAYNMSISKITSWAQSQLPQLHRQVNAIFTKMDPSNTGVPSSPTHP